MLTEDQIRKISAEVSTKIDWTKVGRDDDFGELGLDSLDRYDIIIGLQEATEFEVPDEDVEKLNTIASIETYFSEK